MPPPKSAYRLTPQQKETLRRWIAEGARYEGHWAYAPIQRVDHSDPSDGFARSNNSGPRGIDSFLAAEWQRAGLAPAPPADPRTRLRRLAIDLTGLPPSPEEVAAFAAEPKPERWRETVNRYARSREFGEHFAARWLDLVRYADSSGIASDEPIDTQAYRAYAGVRFIQLYHTGWDHHGTSPARCPSFASTSTSPPPRSSRI